MSVYVSTHVNICYRNPEQGVSGGGVGKYFVTLSHAAKLYSQYRRIAEWWRKKLNSYTIAVKRNKLHVSQPKHQSFRLPKNLESGKGPFASSFSLLDCLDLERRFFSFFLLFTLDFDLFDSLSSSSLLDASDDELELVSEDRREC